MPQGTSQWENTACLKRIMDAKKKIKISAFFISVLLLVLDLFIPTNGIRIM
jgi:hypothetical protein